MKKGFGHPRGQGKIAEVESERRDQEGKKKKRGEIQELRGRNRGETAEEGRYREFLYFSLMMIYQVLEDGVLGGVYISTPICYACPTEAQWHEIS
ncbi:hypothetical protein SLEP1_g51020 [Rubroshorea leprosula]|uniref:Uncharacterized protein n=1 Tax=Rubroshorea leprosula TaxID=152421 RepID=A0AAV5M5E9_9ROSI|nr:hypothetical protein SLEP1_g51020 [Rubroshorea leprosula]